VDDGERYRDALLRARIIADPRKFRDYVLRPGHPRGKDRVFLGTLGFRANSAVDAWNLARLYEEQARQQIVAGAVTFGRADEHGLRCTIIIVVRDVELRTGWLLRFDDVLWLVTPFSGFAQRRSKG
jgi:hypothetical protein